MKKKKKKKKSLDGTIHYVGLLLAPAEGFGLQPFLSRRQRLRHFQGLEITLVNLNKKVLFRKIKNYFIFI